MNILYIGDSPHAITGMGRVAKAFGLYGNKENNIYYYAFNAYSNNRNISSTFEIFPAQSQNHILNDSDINIIFNICIQKRIDVIFCQGDVFYFAAIETLKERYLLKPSSPVYFSQNAHNVSNLHPLLVGYFNIDGEIKDPLLYKRIVSNFDVIITASHFAADELRKIGIKDVSVIYHGYSPSEFKREEKQFKEKLERKENIFLYGSVMQLTGRKNVLGLLETFAKLKQKGYNNIKLLLKVNPSIEMSIAELYNLIYKEELEDTVLIADFELSQFYQTIDFYITTTLGEGFGLPILEAMACGVPVIGSENSSLRELIDDNRGFLIPCYSRIYAPNSKLQLQIPDITEAALIVKHSTEIKKNTKVYTKMSDSCKAFAENYTWDNCMKDIYSQLRKPKQNNKIILFPQVNNYYNLGILTNKKKIAIVKTGGIGDCLQTIPLIKHLKKKYGDDYDIDILSQNGKILEKPIFSNFNNVRVYNIPNLTQQEMFKSAYNTLDYDYIYDIRYVSRVYSAAKKDFIDSEYFKKYAYYYYYWTLSNRDLPKLQEHVVNIMLKSLDISTEENITVDKININDKKEKIDKFTLLNFSSKLPCTKKIDIVKYVKTITNKYRDKLFVLTGTEDVFLQEIKEDNLINLINKTDFDTLLYYINKSDRIICVDSGVMWLSKVMNKKNVDVLFASTPIVNFGFPEFRNLSLNKCEPCWGIDSLHGCPLGMQYCMNLVPPEDI